MKMVLKKVTAVVLVVVMVFGAIQISGIDFSTKASAATFDDINQAGVFYQGTISGPCNLAAITMMIRRTYIALGYDWSTVTQNSVQSAICVSGTYSPYYSRTYGSINISHASLPSTNRESYLINLLANHPEGVSLYNDGIDGKQHAVLLTDYTEGVFYCADYNYASPDGRIPLSSVYDNKVTIARATEYWYVSSPKVTLDLPYTQIPDAVNNLHSEKQVYNSSESINFQWDAAARTQNYWIYLWKDGVSLYSYDCGINTSFTSAPTSPGNYTLIIRPGNNVGFNDSSASYSFIVTDSVPKPTWATVTADKKIYQVGEAVTLTLQSDYATGYVLGLDRLDSKGYWIERLQTLDIESGYKVVGLSAGYYSVYVTAYNSLGSLDTQRYVFSVDPIGTPLNIGSYCYGTFLNYPLWCLR